MGIYTRSGIFCMGKREREREREHCAMKCMYACTDMLVEKNNVV